MSAEARPNSAVNVGTSQVVRDALFESLVEHSGRAKKYGYDLVDGLLADLRSLPVEQRMEAMGMHEGRHFDTDRQTFAACWVEDDRG